MPSPSPPDILHSFRTYHPTHSGSLYPPLQRAGVLVPLKIGDDGEVYVLLTLRSNKLRKHGGEVALPGGKVDPSDRDIYATAKREAWEEIGLPPDSVEILTTLHNTVSRFNVLVTPVVALVPLDFVPTPNHDEVAECFSVPLRRFVMDVDRTHVDIMWEGVPYRAHSFMYKGYKIWGMTATIVIEAARVAYGDTAFELNAPGQLPPEKSIEHFEETGWFSKNKL
ncbi:hypothetical protein HK104_000342 [Borealophlyctis nickersoniae]|nr:hypothetical protein HK104_000342 [Borealophlyctis nickersoniae]